MNLPEVFPLLMPMIETENLTSFYGQKTVVKDFSISVDQSDIFTLLGANGSGKSTSKRIRFSEENNVVLVSSDFTFKSLQAFSYSAITSAKKPQTISGATRTRLSGYLVDVRNLNVITVFTKYV